MNPDMMMNYVLETRFPTQADPKASKPIRENLSLDAAMLKVDAMLIYLEGLGWEIDEPGDGGPTDWVVAKLTPNGYVLGSLSVYEGEA